MEQVGLGNQRSPPPLGVALGVSALAAVLWASLNLALFPAQLLPLTSTLVLLLVLWHRRLWLLWATAVFSLGFLVAEMALEIARRMPFDMPLAVLGIVKALTLLLMTLVLHRLVRNSARLTLTLNELGEAHRQAQEHLATIARQQVQLQQSQEKLEAWTQSVEELNGELLRREQMLQTLLSITGGNNQEVLKQFCQAAQNLMGPAVAAAAILEHIGDRLEVHAQAGFSADAITSWPYHPSLAAHTIQENITASLEDLREHPELAVPRGVNQECFRSMLATPLRIGQEPIGSVQFYARESIRWSPEQCHLAEWISVQCSRVLESLRLQDALKATHQELVQTLDNMSDGFVTLDRGWNYTYVNSSAAAIAHRPREELLGQSFWTSCNAPKRERLLPIMEPTMRGKTARRVEEFYGPPLNIWLEFRCFPTAEGMSLFVADITTRKRSESALSEAMEALKQANQAKDQFLAVLSHELRTPLTPVVLMTQMMEEDQALPVSAREQLSMIHRNVELEARLIDDLLDLTRISRGKLSLRNDIVNLLSSLRHAISVCLTPEVHGRGIRLDLRVDAQAPIPWVWGDASRLEQVFWNLFNNAIKFSPDQSRIDIEAAPVGDEPRWRIQVRDSGVGIDPALIGSLFNAFEQGGSRTTRRFGGLGLGLTISRAIVQMHGGTLTAQSPGPGKGATFTVELPLAKPELLPRPAASSPAIPRPNLLCLTRPLLLIEDHPDTARIMTKLLEDSGYRVLVAHCIKEALRLAEEARGELCGIISDLGLPDGTGLELMRELKHRYQLHGIALSGYGMEEDVRQSLEAGFLTHLTKPVDIAHLQQAIGEMLAAV